MQCEATAEVGRQRFQIVWIDSDEAAAPIKRPVAARLAFLKLEIGTAGCRLHEPREFIQQSGG